MKSTASKQPAESQAVVTEAQIKKLQEELAKAQATAQKAKDAELRSLADYQNLVRRTQEDRSRLVLFANKDLIEDLLQPLNHLSLAAAQLKDAGLSMTVDQLWQALNKYGLEEINPVNQPFDLETMEVVEKKGNSDTVLSVISKGYKLNGDVIQHAKVVVGDK